MTHYDLTPKSRTLLTRQWKKYLPDIPLFIDAPTSRATHRFAIDTLKFVDFLEAQHPEIDWGNTGYENFIADTYGGEAVELIRRIL